MLKLKQFWQWRKRLWNRLLGMEAPPPPPPPPRTITDADRERRFMQLLDEVERQAPDWQVRGFVLANGILGEEWVVWLRGFGDRFLETPTGHEKLARLMVRLGELEVREVGEVAGEIGRQLLAAPREVGSLEVEETDGEVVVEVEDEREDVDVRAEEWFERSQQQFMEKDFRGALGSWDKVVEMKPDYDLGWFLRGLMLSYFRELPEAIASYDKALAIKPDHYSAWDNRGGALEKLGELSEAIASFDKALAIKPDHYSAWDNRGNALSKLGEFSEAIASFDKALAIKPDYHSAWNGRGIALSELRELSEAIASYDKALGIKPDYHSAWLNRGIAVGKAVSYNPIAAETLQARFADSPPAMLNPQLTRCGYEGQLLCYEEGLKHCPADSHPEGFGMLHREIGRRHYSRGRYDYSHFRTLYGKAVSSYHKALSTLTKEAYPQLHLETLRDLIKALLGLGRLAEAKQLRRDGTDLLRRLVAEKRSQPDKQRMALDFADFQQLTVDLAVQAGQWREAWEAAEEGKNACLSWLLYALADESPQCGYAEVEKLLREDRAIVYWHSSPIALTAFVLKHGEDAPVVVSSGVSTDAAAEDSSKEAPLWRKVESDRLIQFEEWLEKWNQLYGDYRDGKKQEKTRATWLDELPEMLRQLKIILDIEAIETALGEAKNLILIPHRDLHRLPLHSLFGDRFAINYLPSAAIGLATDFVTDLTDELVAGELANYIAFIESVRYNILSPLNPPLEKGDFDKSSPPFQRGAGGDKKTVPHRFNNCYTSVLSVENPKSLSEFGDKQLASLPAAELESEYLCHLLPNGKRLAREEVIQQEVEEELSKPWDIFHFSGHANYDFKQPCKSALYLTGKERLRAEDIVKLNLENCRLVCLSGCETAVTGSETITAEYVGLVSAFLSRGVDRVVSTLWTVRSDAAALITIQFYRLLLLENIPPVEALNLATRWLRSVTCGDLAKWYEMVRDELPKDESMMRPFLRNRMLEVRKKQPTQRVYSNPYYWAAFVISGSW